MRTVIISLISFAAGTLFGLGFMCCFIVAGQEDRQLEKENKEQEANSREQYILFFLLIG